MVLGGEQGDGTRGHSEMEMEMESCYGRGEGDESRHANVLYSCGDRLHSARVRLTLVTRTRRLD